MLTCFVWSFLLALTRSRRHDPDGSSERHRGPEAEEVPAHPDEEQGPEDQDDGRDPQRDQDLEALCMGNVVPGQGQRLELRPFQVIGLHRKLIKWKIH